jgi:uncharacterized lipoprotein YmbA
VKHPLLNLTALTAITCLIGACANPTPAPQLYTLRPAPPVPVEAVPGTQVLQLMLPVVLPELLERDALWLPQGQAGVRALASHRWAEPLRDAVPRLLRQDLAALMGEARVWVAPLPAGANITRQLRVEVLVLQVNADQRGVTLQARWTVSDPGGRVAPVVQNTQVSVPATASEPDAWVVAQRLALWQLAVQVAQRVR